MSFLVSIGDSSRFRVYFDGSREEFEKSAELQKIKDSLYGDLKDKFPTGGYKEVDNLVVADDDGRDYADLDDKALEELKKQAERQVEVLRQGEKLNNNAPFDNI